MVEYTISHFRILKKIGSGSMGEVFKAEDLNLGRNVALKFLAEHLRGDDAARKRFHREARATAALSHPNICTVYEVIEAEGKMFLAMELVEGEGLDQLLGKGPLPLADALDIASQIAEGLREAHRKGVVHRDIKPSNIMLTEIAEGVSRAKVLDFGLARLTRASEVSTGGQKGTPAYMAPEQIMGTYVDARADIWSNGAVLFEMVTGRHPFEGKYVEAIHYSILLSPLPRSGSLGLRRRPSWRRSSTALWRRKRADGMLPSTNS